LAEYNLDGSPCEGVVKQAARTLRSGVRAMFPEDEVLQDLGVESYVGRPLYSSAGKVIGLMVLMSRKPICDAERAETMMEIFAGRASAEFERRQHELAMKKTDLLFRQVTDNIAPTVYVATPGLTEFLYVSPRFATFWGLQPARLLLEPDLWFVGVHPDDRALLSQAHAGWSSWADDAQVCEFRVVHAQTGHERWLRDRCWKIWNTADSLEPRVVGIVEDVSIERRALEHLDKARQMAEEASTAKTLFLANVSHGMPIILAVLTFYSKQFCVCVCGGACACACAIVWGVQRYEHRCRGSWECWSCWSLRICPQTSGTTF
jgi:PAS domain-containing protein